MSGFSEETNSLFPDSEVILYDFDTTPLLETPTGNDTYYFTNAPVGLGGHITWQGNNYLPSPFTISRLIDKSDASAPERPILTVSNINETFYSLILTLGDLSGCIVRRWITYYKFTDNGSSPDTLAHGPIHEFALIRKKQQNKFIIEYELGTSLDRPGLKLPKRLILRDKTNNSLYAPGVSRVRLRG